ncbi:MAG: LON peptidase substrate-binding domain-containing protein, partial [Methanosarcina sp.]|nr:LON peptidase substrate-binding domain-containing protein [Methanosarcina sp.]
MYTKNTDENIENIVMPLFEVVVYPKSRAKFLADKATGEILSTEMKNAEPVYAVGLTVKSGTIPSDLSEDDLYKTGNLLKIVFVQPADEGYLVVAKAVQRVEVVSLYRKDGLFYATYEPVMDLQDLDEDVQAEMIENVKTTVNEISSRFQGSEKFTRPIEKMVSIDQIMGYVMPFMPIKLEEKQALLEIVSVRERYLKFVDILMEHKENINFQMEIAKKVTDKISKSHREAMLREQLKVIQEELNENEDSVSGEGGYRERIENSKMPDEVRKKALSELKKLETGGSHNPESPVIRNYLDLMLDLPWVTEEKKNIDIDEARRVLEKNHNGLEKVKERIIQHLAVMKLKKEKQGSILLFIGPPGTGKTSLGKSIADALGREYVRASLGGVKDESEIRGHRRTYVGALPGRIIQGMKKAGTKNPVFILDE